MTNQHQLIQLLNKELAIELPEKISFEALSEKLSAHINQLIDSNFQKLVSILYRVDVSELKLQLLLKENADTDASKIIADLIIERQLQKIKSRQEFSDHNRNISDEEKW